MNTVPCSSPAISTPGLCRPWGVLLAAGSGTRMAAVTDNVPKQFFFYRNAPLYWQSALTFSRCARLAGLIFVFPLPWMEEETRRLHHLDTGHVLGLPWRAVAGGPLRQDSVRLGIAALPPHVGHVLVHDAARPFVSAALICRLCDGLAQGHAGVIPVVPVADTVKVVEGGHVVATPDRHSLRAVQTPQAFVLAPLRNAHERALEHGWNVTDDASLLERCGFAVAVVEGEAANVKMTSLEDIRMLESPTTEQQIFLPRTGFGYDVHRFGLGRPLRLGGIAMPGDLCVQAHSDGDVLLHALMDAILGCACAGDIGQHFPDSVPALDNVHSAVLLDRVLTLAREAGLRLIHADLTVIAQKPKIAPHREAIRRNVARLLSLEPGAVNIKATTEEGLGFTGSGEGIKALAVVTALHKPHINVQARHE